MIITVVSLGVVGGSFVKALKGQGHEVYGIDIDEKTLQMAKNEGTIIEGFTDGKEIIFLFLQFIFSKTILEILWRAFAINEQSFCRYTIYRKHTPKGIMRD